MPPVPELFPPAGILAGNLLAVALVWVWAVLPGLPLAVLPRVPVGRSAAPLFGLAYWAASLYLLPFAGGQTVAMALAAVAGGVSLLRAGRELPAGGWRGLRSPSAWLLAATFLSLHTLVACNFVPVGMDASMHATSARLIAGNAGLPRTHAPFAPELPSPAVNLGLPALAAAAVRCGATPEAATLATAPFAYVAFVLAVAVLVRPWVPRGAAACLAVVGLVSSRGLQETVAWGGYPTVAGVAVGALAGRLAYDLLRRPSVRSGLVTGFVVAAIPLVHGIAAAIWAYVAGPLLLLAALGVVRRWRDVIPGGVAVLAVAAAVFGTYLAVGRSTPDDAARQWTREYQQAYAPKGEGVALLRSAAADVVRWAGDEPAAGLAAALAWLLVRGRWRAAAAVTAGAGMTLVVVLNSTVWLLPGSVALYPERAPFALNVLFPLALAVGWRAVPRWSRRLTTGWALGGAAVVGLCVPKYLDRYQRSATLAAVPPERRQLQTFPVAGRDEYDVLCWCRDHLDPARDLVEVAYNTAGSYLPAVAGVPCTGWHVHCFVLPDFYRLLASRPATHLVAWGVTDDQPRQVYRAGRMAVLRHPSAR